MEIDPDVYCSEIQEIINDKDPIKALERAVSNPNCNTRKAVSEVVRRGILAAPA